MTEKSDDKKKAVSDIEKLRILIPYWINHNNDHIRDNEKWLKKTIGLGLEDVGHELKEAIEILKKANMHTISCNRTDRPNRKKYSKQKNLKRS